MLSYQDLVNGQTANPPTYDQTGMLTATAQSGGAYKPLPQLNPQGQPTYSGSQTTDPIAQFNMNLFKMLQDAQAGNNNAPLMNQRQDLNNANINASLGAPGGGLALRPEDSLSARKDAGNTYDPAIKNLNDRIALNNQAITDFKSALDSAKSFGAEYEKYVKPGDDVVKAVKEQMAGGYLPDSTILDKVRTSLTSQDWNALAKAQVDKKLAGSTTNVFNMDSTKEIDNVKAIIDAHPGEWGQAAAAINQRLNDPTAATRYDALLKQSYLLPDQVQKITSLATNNPPKSVAEWQKGRDTFIKSNTYVDATTAGKAYDSAVPKPSVKGSIDLSNVINNSLSGQ